MKSVAKKLNKIKQMRLEARMSQNQLARKAELDRGTVASAEAGKSVQDLTLSKIASALSAALGRPVDIEEISSVGV